MISISNNHPSVKNIRYAHLFRSDRIPYSLSEVLKNSYNSFINSDDYIRVAVLPENVKPNASQKNSNSGSYWSNRITMDINEQSQLIRSQLDTYDNATVVCCLETRSGTVYIYGNSDQPLSMLYKDIESTNNMDLIGHQITLSGDTYNSPKIITTTDFYEPSRLASWLATPL